MATILVSRDGITREITEARLAYFKACGYTPVSEVPQAMSEAVLAPSDEGEGGAASKSMAELREAAKKLDIEVPARVTKAELVELLAAAGEE